MGASTTLFRIEKPVIPLCIATTKAKIGQKIDEYNANNELKINGSMTLLAQEIYMKFIQRYNKGFKNYSMSSNNIELASWTRMSDRSIKRHILRLLDAGIFAGKEDAPNSFSNYTIFINQDLLVYSRMHETAWKEAKVQKSPVVEFTKAVEVEATPSFEPIVFNLSQFDGCWNVDKSVNNTKKTETPNVDKFEKEIKERLANREKNALNRSEINKNQSEKFLLSKTCESNFLVHEDKMSSISSCQELQKKQEPYKKPVDMCITKNNKNKQSGNHTNFNFVLKECLEMMAKKEKKLR